VILCAAPVVGEWWADDLVRLYRQANYDEAREQFASGQASDGDPDWTAPFWEMQLAQDPDAALAASQLLQEGQDVPAPIQQRAVLEQASIHFARGDYRQALAPLVALADRQDRLAGEHYLLMGLCYWALQRVQKSREAFATIPQSDPNFVWARYYLGHLGVETGDLTLALRYFESANRSELASRTPALMGGQWEVLQREGDLEEAARLYQTVMQDHPYSLAALRMRDLASRQAAGQLGEMPLATTDTVSSDPQTRRGRFSLQLAAFADRSHALTYLAAWQAELPQLRIDEESDPAYPVLYKIRLGHFVSRSQAQTESERLHRHHGLDALIVESGP
jgi:tetratricopeptide (TPR) repeat protein